MISGKDRSTQKRLVLAPFVKAGFLSGILYFGLGSASWKVIVPSLQLAVLDAARLMRIPRTLDALKIALQEMGHADEVIQECLAGLVDRFLFSEEEAAVCRGGTGHECYLAMSGASVLDSAEKLAKSTIVILGCGAVGGAIAHYLASHGIGRVILIDDGKVDEVDIATTPVFDKLDLGRCRAMTVKSYLSRKFSITVEALQREVSEDSIGDLLGADLVIASDPDRDLAALLNKASLVHRFPWLLAGFVAEVAYWGPLIIPGETGCFNCRVRIINPDGVEPDLQELCREINSGFQPAYNSSVLSIAASFASLDVVRYLVGFGNVQSLENRIGIWTNNLRVEQHNYTVNPDCQICANYRNSETLQTTVL